MKLDLSFIYSLKLSLHECLCPHLKCLNPERNSILSESAFALSCFVARTARSKRKFHAVTPQLKGMQPSTWKHRRKKAAQSFGGVDLSIGARSRTPESGNPTRIKGGKARGGGGVVEARSSGLKYRGGSLLWILVANNE